MISTESLPKIRHGRVQENQRRIEAAALALFTRQGFHGTNSRQIAEKAEVSTGAIYTYYVTKEALFVSLVRNYETRMNPLRDQMFNSIKEPFSKPDIRKRLGPLFSEATAERMVREGFGFVFASIYMYVFEYFPIEKLFQGNHHLGVSDDEAVDGFVDLFSRYLEPLEGWVTTLRASENGSACTSVFWSRAR